MNETKAKNINIMKAIALAIAREMNIDKKIKIELNIDVLKNDVRINLTQFDI